MRGDRRDESHNNSVRDLRKYSYLLNFNAVARFASTTLSLLSLSLLGRGYAMNVSM